MKSECAEEISASTLRDGTMIQLRRLHDTDFNAVIALHDTLTDRERYLRFFTTHPAYLKTLTSKLTEDNSKDFALGAFDSGLLIGVANYVVCGNPDTAEVAVVVAHDDHLRGVGTALLRWLAQIARANEIRRFVADIWATNHLMFKVLHDAGLPPRRKDYSYGVVHLEIDPADIAPRSEMTGDTTRPGVGLCRPENISVAAYSSRAGDEHR